MTMHIYRNFYMIRDEFDDELTYLFISLFIRKSIKKLSQPHDQLVKLLLQNPFNLMLDPNQNCL